MIAFLGSGLLGSNFVRAMLSRGEQVHVWNRSASKAKALEQYGAIAFDSVEDAVRGADRIHVTLSDDAAVDDVLEHARTGIRDGVAIVDHTTTSPEGTRARVERWTTRGIDFLHAPVFMGPPNALAATGVMLASGEEARFERLRPHLEVMTGTVVYLGSDPARAAGIKLVGNLFIVELTGAIGDSVALAKSMGIPGEDVAKLFEFFNPGAQVTGRLKRMLDANFTHPSWTLAMARKDTRLMLEAARAGDVELTILPRIAEQMDAWIAKGRDQDDWMVINSDIV